MYLLPLLLWDVVFHVVSWLQIWGELNRTLQWWNDQKLSALEGGPDGGPLQVSGKVSQKAHRWPPEVRRRRSRRRGTDGRCGGRRSRRCRKHQGCRQSQVRQNQFQDYVMLFVHIETSCGIRNKCTRNTWNLLSEILKPVLWTQICIIFGKQASDSHQKESWGLWTLSVSLCNPDPYRPNCPRKTKVRRNFMFYQLSVNTDASRGACTSFVGCLRRHILRFLIWKKFLL